MDSFHSCGDWDFSYLEPVKSKRIQFFGDRDVDLFEVEAPTIIKAGSNYHYIQKKKGKSDKEQGKKQGRVCYVTCGTPNAVDEDLYKIPPELLYRIPKRKRVLGNFLTGCLGNIFTCFTSGTALRQSALVLFCNSHMNAVFPSSSIYSSG